MMFSNSFFGMPYYNRYSRYGYRYPSYPHTQNEKKKDNIGVSSTNNTNSNTHNNNTQHHTQKSTAHKPPYSRPIYSQKEQSRKNSDFKNRKEEVKKQVKEEKKEENRGILDLDSPLFEILGISLYFDDILLLCMIFFLYQEGVKDISLFIALILLLLS